MGEWLFIEPDTILLDGVLKPLGGDPALTSHSEAIGVASRTFVRRGICVLMRRFSITFLAAAAAPLSRWFRPTTHQQ
jgi:hypothetical protein